MQHEVKLVNAQCDKAVPKLRVLKECVKGRDSELLWRQRKEGEAIRLLTFSSGHQSVDTRESMFVDSEGRNTQ